MELDRAKDIHLAAKKAEFAENLPDVLEWESYLSDEDVTKLFKDHLNALEQAPQECFELLEQKPGKTSLIWNLCCTFRFPALYLNSFKNLAK